MSYTRPSASASTGFIKLMDGYALLLLSILVISRCNVCDSTATITLQLSGFNNPTQRLYDLSCCNVPCTTPCINIYEVCFGDSNPTSPSCSVPDNQSFDSITLPVVTYQVSSLNGSLPVKIIVQTPTSQDIDFTSFVLTTYPATITPLASRTYYPTNFSSVSVTATCDPNYYGTGCDKYCVPTNTYAGGHYMCNATTGTQICGKGWSGTNCLTPLTACPALVTLSTGLCQALDIVFILDSSGSVNKINSNNWALVKTFLKSVVDRVTLGPYSYQISVVTFSNSASLDIKLSDFVDPAALKSRIDMLPYLGNKTNLRGALYTTRTQAFAPSNGGRPNAYKSVILVYDGEPPSPEYGTLVDEASKLKNLNIDVSVVSLSYYFSQNLASPALVQSISSTPYIDHLFFPNDWTTLSSTVAPTILANLQDTCMRKGAYVNVNTGTGSTLPSTASSTTSSSTSTTSSSSSGGTLDPYCNSHGTCSGSSSLTSSYSYPCYCMPGYAGPHCEYLDDPCSYNPCKGYGQCTSVDNINYICSCYLGFSGPNCNISGGPITCDNNTAPITPTPCTSIPAAPCAQFYYGPNCVTVCIPQDLCTGHYSCATDGSMVCLPGWNNTSSSCTVNAGYTSTPACSPVCSTLNGAFCFNQGCCCPSGFTGPDCSVVVSTSSSSSPNTGSTGSTGTTTVPTSTTLSDHDILVNFIYNYVIKNFPNFNSVQIEEALNALLAAFSSVGPQFADLPGNVPPVYVSTPWPGTGLLVNYSVQLEILKAVLTQPDGKYQLAITYDYILTSPNGSVSRVSATQYAQLTLSDQQSTPTDTSLLNPNNQLTLVVYGTYLDTSYLIKFTQAIGNAYMSFNKAWSIKPSARVVIGQVDEMVGLNGEMMTSFKFWLVSGAASDENVSSIVAPTDLSLVSELNTALSVASLVVHHSTSFRMIDSFGVYVIGRVYRTDVDKFESAVARYWNLSASLVSYQNLRVNIVLQDTYRLTDGTLVSRLVYFVYNTTYTLPNTGSVMAPTSENLQASLSFTALDGSTYRLLPSSQQSALYRYEMAFSVITIERVPRTLFSTIQTRLQAMVQTVQNYNNAVVNVVSTGEYFSVEKQVTFSKTLWYITNNGSVVDGRVYGTTFAPMWQIAASLGAVQLPNGNNLTYFLEDLTLDTQITRESCFYVYVAGGAVLNSSLFETALRTALAAQSQSWTANAVSLSLVYREQYVNTNGSGSLATAVMYSVFEINSESVNIYGDATTFPSDLISTPTLTNQLSTICVTRGCYQNVLLDKSSSSVMSSLQRYVNILSLFTVEPPGLDDVPVFIRNLEAIYDQSLSSSARVISGGVEEFFTSTGSSVWRLGYFLFRGMTVVWPEVVAPITSNTIQSSLDIRVHNDNTAALKTYTDSYYTVLAQDQSSRFTRAADLFRVVLTERISANGTSALENVLAQAFKQSFTDLQLAAVATRVVSVKELLLLSQQSSVYQIYYEVQADGWSVSARMQASPSYSILFRLIGGLSDAQGHPYVLSAITGNTTLSFRADFAYSITLQGSADVDMATASIQAGSACWAQQLGTSSGVVVPTLRSLKSTYGLYGIPVTNVLYSVVVNGNPLSPMTDPSPALSGCLTSVIQQAVSSVSIYSLPLSAVSSQDDLFSVFVTSPLTIQTLADLRLVLLNSWTKSAGRNVNVTIVGTEQRIASFNDMSFETVVWYSVFVTSGGGSKQLSAVDVAIPYIDVQNNANIQLSQNAALPLGSLLLLHDGKLSADDIYKATSALVTSVSQSLQTGLNVRVLPNTQQLYSTTDWRHVTRVDYVTTLNDKYYYEEISSNGLTQSLSGQALSLCLNRTSRTFRLYTTSSSLQLSPVMNGLTSELTRTWSNLNPGVGKIEINLNLVASRKKRATTGDAPTYQNILGAPVTTVDYTVLVGGVGGGDPNPLFVQFPSYSAMTQSLTASGLSPACNTTTTAPCTLLECSLIHVLGSIQSASDLKRLQVAITNAYIIANSFDSMAANITVSLGTSVVLYNQSGAAITEVRYCITTSPDGTGMDPYATPTFNELSIALLNAGLTQVNVTTTLLTQPPQQPTSTDTKTIIIAVVVCGVVALAVISIIAWRVAVYCRNKRNQSPDKKRLSETDSDSFIGHGLYNTSPFSTINKQPGTMHSKIHFVDAINP